MITTVLVAAAIGLVIGAVVGGLGGGGGVLTVPALVYLLGQTAQDATTGSVLIVGITSLAGVAARWRGGVDFRLALAFGVVGVPAAWLGSAVNRHTSQPVLLLAFAGLTVVAAAAMLLDARTTGTDADEAGPAGTARPATAVLAHPTTRQRTARALKILTCGAAVGFLTGFLGVGGGFLVVPALVVAIGLPLRTAIGTSQLIIVGNAVASVASRADHLHLDWQVLAPFTAAAVVATIAGKYVADRLTADALTRAFAVMLVGVGLFVAVRTLTGG